MTRPARSEEEREIERLDKFLVRYLGRGMTDREAAVRAGVPREQVYERLEANPELQKRIESLRKEELRAVRGRAVRLIHRALSKLGLLLDNPDPHVQLKAASLLLGSLPKLHPQARPQPGDMQVQAAAAQAVHINLREASREDLVRALRSSAS